MDAPVQQRLPVDEQIRLIEGTPVPSFNEHLASAGEGPLQAQRPEVIQVNLGKLCNQRCHHCHVDAGPHQTKANMNRETAEAVVDLITKIRPRTVDVTGGAPELNPHFRFLVESAKKHGVTEVIDRCNLTVLMLKDQHDLAHFLAEHQVHVVASLPAVNAKQTDAQRGDGIFDRSLKGLALLNTQGYGRQSELPLTLMANPAGAFLPPPQESTEKRFRHLLHHKFNVDFTNLIQLTNMPIARFLEFLESRALTGEYLQRLSAAFNGDAVNGLMCRNTLSIGYDGRIFDCDFNQMLDLPSQGQPTVFNVNIDDLQNRPIVTRRHCLGCTAGQGSSCGGATAA